MALPTSGSLSFTQIYNEIFGTSTVPVGTSLADLASGANSNGCRIGTTNVNYSLPHSMSEFYGLDCSPLTAPSDAFNMEIVGSSFTIEFDLSTASGVTQANRHVIYWGDGQVTNVKSSYDGLTNYSISHTYSSSGTYQVTVASDGDVYNNGRINGLSIGLTDSINKAKLRKITKWGDFAFLNVSGSHFSGCSNMTVTATDTPHLHSQSGFGAAFISCSSLTTIPSLNQWNIGIMSGAFLGNMFNFCTNWNQDISGWDVTGLSGSNSNFINSTSFSSQNYDLLLDAWSSQNVNSGVSISFDACYSNSLQRGVLTNNYSWSIVDEGQCLVVSPPSNLRLSSYNVDENSGTNAFIADILSDGGAATYSIGLGGNSQDFNINNGNDLRTAFNFTNGGTSKSVTINATNDGGSISDTFTIFINSVSTIPSAPSSFQVANLQGQSDVFLSWNDNSNNENGFRIEVSINSGAYNLLTSVGANTISYNDTNPKLNLATYRYRIRSYNGSGSSTWVYSNQVTIDTSGGIEPI